MQADNPPPSRARHTAVVVRVLLYYVDSVACTAFATNVNNSLVT